jgi:hypothetical protein
MTHEIVADCEVFKNLVLIGAQDLDGSNRIEIEIRDRATPEQIELMHRVFKNSTSYWFNWVGYDSLICAGVLAGFDTADVHRLSKDIIASGKRSWEVRNDHGLTVIKDWPAVDLMNFAARGSLKKYSARMGRDVQDFVFDPDADVLDDQMAAVRHYLFEGDLNATANLRMRLNPEIDARMALGQVTGVDGLMQVNDAKAGERVILAKYCERTGVEVAEVKAAAARNRGRKFRFALPKWVRDGVRGTGAEAPAKAMHGCWIQPCPTTGRLKVEEGLWPAEFDIDGVITTLGFGGLHSVDPAGNLSQTKVVDAASMYPHLLLGEGGAPDHLIESEFHSIYRGILDQRLAAKKAGDKRTANALKLALNSVYGKLGDIYSSLYSPQAQLRCTAAGQLSLITVSTTKSEK